MYSILGAPFRHALKRLMQGKVGLKACKRQAAVLHAPLLQQAGGLQAAPKHLSIFFGWVQTTQEAAQHPHSGRQKWSTALANKMVAVASSGLRNLRRLHGGPQQEQTSPARNCRLRAPTPTDPGGLAAFLQL